MPQPRQFASGFLAVFHHVPGMELFTLGAYRKAMFQAVFIALIMVNLLTALRFWQDKRYAIAGARRIPEADLLGLALIGGTPAAFAARHLFRHKTRKQPFSTYLQLIGVLQVGGITGWYLL